MWLYSDSRLPDDKVRGAALWSKFVANSLTFYMHNADIEVLEKALVDLKGRVRSGFSLIDLGPGSAEAFEAKSMKIVQSLSPAAHYIVDGAKEFRDSGAAQLNAAIAAGTVSGLEKIAPVNANFFKPMGLVETDSSKPCLVYIGGGTIANLPIIHADSSFPREEYVSYFKQLHGVGHGKVSLLVPFDTNQDGPSLISSYADRAYGEWVENLPYRMARDLPIEPIGRRGFRPEAFKYEQLWIPEAYLMAHTLVVQRDQIFKIGGTEVHLEQGSRLYLNSSYKMPSDVMKSIARDAGWEAKAEYPAANGKYTAVYFQQNSL